MFWKNALALLLLLLLFERECFVKVTIVLQWENRFNVVCCYCVSRQVNLGGKLLLTDYCSWFLCCFVASTSKPNQDQRGVLAMSSSADLNGNVSPTNSERNIQPIDGLYEGPLESSWRGHLSLIDLLEEAGGATDDANHLESETHNPEDVSQISAVG